MLLISWMNLCFSTRSARQTHTTCSTTWTLSLIIILDQRRTGDPPSLATVAALLLPRSFLAGWFLPGPVENLSPTKKYGQWIGITSQEWDIAAVSHSLHPPSFDRCKIEVVYYPWQGRKKNVFSVMQAELARCVVCYRWGQVKEPFVADHCCPCKTVESTASLGMNCFLGWVLQLWLFCSREKVAWIFREGN